MAVVVFDGGSSTVVRLGLAASLQPARTFPNIVHSPTPSPQGPRFSFCPSAQDAWVGDALKRVGYTECAPVRGSVVEDWEAMERVYDHSFCKEIEIPPEETDGLLLTQPAENPHPVLQRTVQILFEDFGFPNLHVATGAVLALFTTGRVTGLGVDIGHGSCSTVPVYNGNGLAMGSARTPLGGEMLNGVLQHQMAQHAFKLSTREATLLKETKCFVALDYASEAQVLQNNSDKYELPDAGVVDLHDIPVAAPELLFAPPDGLAIQVQSSISKCAKQLQSQLLANVVVAGGLGAGLSGLPQRVEQEVHASTVLRAPAAGNAPWVGGSILSSLPTFDGFWMSAESWEENGESAMHRMLNGA